MTNGGIIGPKNSPSLSSASGIWGIREQYSANKNNLWQQQIVSDNLEFLVDAPFSYPGSGTTAYDLIQNRAGTMYAGVSYNSNGYFSFNNTAGATIHFPLVTTATSNVTLQALVEMPASDGGAIFYNGQGGGYGIGVGGSTFDNAGNDAIGLFQMIRWIDTNTAWGTGWMMVTLSLNSSSVPTFYKNTSLIGSYSGTSPNTPVTNTTLGSDGGFGRNFSGNIAWAGLYTKELSSAEISQNFNVLRGRYGI